MNRIGAVSYLNTRPLIEGLALNPEIELVLDLPSRLSDLLESGAIDVGLIPVADYLRLPHLKPIPDISISCDGPVLSVMIFSRVPMDRVKTLSWDEGSHTSITLTRLLFSRRFGQIPQIRLLPINANLQELKTDAVLLIGNRALSAEMSDYPFAWDLGLEWKRETGLPMVFAIWAATPQANLKKLVPLLKNAKETGLSHIAKLAHEGARELGIDGALCRRYLEQIIRYDLGPKELEGMGRFASLAFSEGILSREYNRHHELLIA